MEEFYICVKFETTNKEYYFQTLIPTLKIGDYVVVETVIGKELGVVTKESRPLSSLKFSKEIKPILRKIDEPYKGKLIHFYGKMIDIKVTPNHRFPLLDSKYTFKGFYTAQEIFDGKVPDISNSYLFSQHIYKQFAHTSNGRYNHTL